MVDKELHDVSIATRGSFHKGSGVTCEEGGREEEGEREREREKERESEGYMYIPHEKAKSLRSLHDYME